MRILKEFKDFAMKGNVVDMAVGVIIGTAFGKIVASLVADIIMPPLGYVIGNVDFSDLAIRLGAPLGLGKPVTVNYGLFLNNIVNFLIVAFALFMVIRGLNSMKRQEPATAAPTTKDCPLCLSKIPLKATRCAFCTSTVPA